MLLLDYIAGKVHFYRDYQEATGHSDLVPELNLFSLFVKTLS